MEIKDIFRDLESEIKRVFDDLDLHSTDDEDGNRNSNSAPSAGEGHATRN